MDNRKRAIPRIINCKTVDTEPAQRWVTDPKTKLGERRILGCGDGVSLYLRRFDNVKQMIVAIRADYGLDLRDLLRSGKHVGIVRMIISNRLRAHLRRQEARQLREKTS